MNEEQLKFYQSVITQSIKGAMNIAESVDDDALGSEQGTLLAWNLAAVQNKLREAIELAQNLDAPRREVQADDEGDV